MRVDCIENSFECSFGTEDDPDRDLSKLHCGHPVSLAAWRKWQSMKSHRPLRCLQCNAEVTEAGDVLSMREIRNDIGEMKAICTRLKDALSWGGVNPYGVSTSRTGTAEEPSRQLADVPNLIDFDIEPPDKNENHNVGDHLTNPLSPPPGFLVSQYDASQDPSSQSDPFDNPPAAPSIDGPRRNAPSNTRLSPRINPKEGGGTPPADEYIITTPKKTERLPEISPDEQPHIRQKRDPSGKPSGKIDIPPPSTFENRREGSSSATSVRRRSSFWSSQKSPAASIRSTTSTKSVTLSFDAHISTPIQLGPGGIGYEDTVVSPSGTALALIEKNRFTVLSIPPDGALKDVDDFPFLCWGMNDGRYQNSKKGRKTRATRLERPTYLRAAMSDNWLCIACNEGYIDIHNSTTSERLTTIDPLEPCWNLAISPDGTVLAVATAGKEVLLYPLNDEQPSLLTPIPLIKRNKHLNLNKIKCMAFSRDSLYLSVCTFGDHVIRTYRLEMESRSPTLITTYDPKLSDVDFGNKSCVMGLALYILA